MLRFSEIFVGDLDWRFDLSEEWPRNIGRMRFEPYGGIMAESEITITKSWQDRISDKLDDVNDAAIATKTEVVILQKDNSPDNIIHSWGRVLQSG